MRAFARMLIFIIFTCLSAATASGENWDDLLEQAETIANFQAYDSAAVLCNEAYKIATSELGENDSTVAYILHRMGVFYYLSGNLSESEKAFQKALSIREAVLTPNHPEKGRTINNLANISADLSRFEEAKEYYARALDIMRANYANDDPKVMSVLENLGLLAMDLGEYPEAEKAFREISAIRKEKLGENSFDYAKGIFLLGKIYRIERKLTSAKQLLEKAYEINKNFVSEQNPLQLQTLHEIAQLYFDQGNIDVAESLFVKVLNIQEGIYNPLNPQIGFTLNNLAVLYEFMGNYELAAKQYERALQIMTSAYGEESLNTTTVLGNLADIYLRLEKPELAEEALNKALRINEKVLGPNHPSVANDLLILGRIFLAKGDYDNAENMLDRTYDINEKTFGFKHKKVADVLLWKSMLSRFMEDQQSALVEAEKAHSILRDLFAENILIMPEKDAFDYMQWLQVASDLYMSILADITKSNADLDNDAFDVVLQSKGKISDEIFSRNAVLLSQTDSNVIELINSLQGARQKLSRVIVNTNASNNDIQKEKQDSLLVKIKQMELKLAEKSLDYRELQKPASINVKRISSQIPDNCGIIEYCKYNYIQMDPFLSQPRYLALVVSSKDECHMVDLGEAEQIEKWINRYRKHMLRVSESNKLPDSTDMFQYARIARELYEQVWNPIEPYVKTDELVLIAPDGGLNLISFAGLIDENDQFLIEKQSIHYLSSGRDIIRYASKDSHNSGDGLLALGNPDFNSYSCEKETGESPDQSEAHLTNSTSIDLSFDCQAFDNIRVDSLPGTEIEIDSIISIWSRLYNDTIIKYTGCNASEQIFKKNSSGKRIIHLATHGYYFDNLCKPEGKNNPLETESAAISYNPLILSGLLLAGANAIGDTNDQDKPEDGILTAYEISMLNLRETELVVLSACETGLGDVKEGEGVYGLRRAFLQAGANSVLSALWPVSDLVTAEMMNKFYGSKTESLYDRIRDMQLKKISELRDKGQAAHPIIWAGFIATGAWNR